MFLNTADTFRRRTGVRGGLAVALALAAAACGESGEGTVGPQVPGSIEVTTVTSGFNQDDSYQLIVDGETSGTIGANDQVVLAELEPATYEVAIDDIASNCTAATATASATVVSEGTVDAVLTIVCAPAAPTPYQLRTSRDRLNLENGEITVCTFGDCPIDDQWDFYVLFDADGDYQSVVYGNQTTEVEVAHVTGRTLATLTEEDVNGATFSLEPVVEGFDPNRVILLRTDAGNVYGLGNPDESILGSTLDFEAVLLVSAP